MDVRKEEIWKFINESFGNDGSNYMFQVMRTYKNVYEGAYRDEQKMQILFIYLYLADISSNDCFWIGLQIATSRHLAQLFLFRMRQIWFILYSRMCSDITFMHIIWVKKFEMTLHKGNQSHKTESMDILIFVDMKKYFIECYRITMFLKKMKTQNLYVILKLNGGRNGTRCEDLNSFHYK